MGRYQVNFNDVGIVSTIKLTKKKDLYAYTLLNEIDSMVHFDSETRKPRAYLVKASNPEEAEVKAAVYFNGYKEEQFQKVIRE